MNRRKFVGTAALASGSLLLQSPSGCTRIAQMATPGIRKAIGVIYRKVAAINIDDIVQQLAIGLGINLISNIDLAQINGMRERIAQTNSILLEGGFTNVVDKVFCDYDSLFHYAKRSDGINACLPFYCNEQGITGADTPLVMLEGPSITGLNYTAHILREDLSSAETQRRLTPSNRHAPAETFSDDLGNWLAGYSQAAKFKNQEGDDVTINYESDGSGQGTIHLLIEHGPGLVFFKKSFTVAYSIETGLITPLHYA